MRSSKSIAQLSLLPRNAFENAIVRARIKNILDSMRRCTEENTPIPKEWLDELQERISYL